MGLHSLWEYMIDPASGALTANGTVMDSRGPVGIAVSPDGTTVYVTDAADNTVDRYTIDPNTERLTPKSPFKVDTGGDPFGIVAVTPVVVPKGRFIRGGPGNDRIFGGSGNDRIFGGSGNDVIRGGWGNDRIYGGPGNDVIRGGPGNDIIRGGTGNDRIYSGLGNDTVHARDGHRDVVDCGPGRDAAFVDPVDVVRGCERVVR
jgi:YVTN family beta-propeller protein